MVILCEHNASVHGCLPNSEFEKNCLSFFLFFGLFVWWGRICQGKRLCPFFLHLNMKTKALPLLPPSPVPLESATDHNKWGPYLVHTGLCVQEKQLHGGFILQERYALNVKPEKQYRSLFLQIPSLLSAMISFPHVVSCREFSETRGWLCFISLLKATCDTYVQLCVCMNLCGYADNIFYRRLLCVGR